MSSPLVVPFALISTAFRDLVDNPAGSDGFFSKERVECRISLGIYFRTVSGGGSFCVDDVHYPARDGIVL